MTYKRDGEQITLQMSTYQYGELLTMLGFALGSLKQMGEDSAFYRTLEFLNELNADNPQYAPYGIPEKHQSKKS